MCFSTPNVPPAQEPPKPIREQDAAVQAALDAERRRRASQGGFKSTVLTGGMGAAPPVTSTKTLLGQ